MLLVSAYTYLTSAFSHGREEKLKEGEKQTWREGERKGERRGRGGYSFISFYETLSQLPYPYGILDFQGHLRTACK